LSTEEAENHFYVRVPGRVLGCLNRGEITVIISAGHGIIACRIIPADWIPSDLIMPNSEFDILMEFPTAEEIRVLRKDESCPEIHENHR
jgi:hypothetical protein